MKFTVNKSDFEKAITPVSIIAQSKTAESALHGIYIEATESTVILYCYDIEKGIRTTVDAFVAGNGSIIADAQIVHEAAIGRINNDQLLKLMTFGMNEEEAEQNISKFYTKLTLDERFVLLEDNTWDLRERQSFDKVHIDMNDIYSEIEEEEKEMEVEKQEERFYDDETVILDSEEDVKAKNDDDEEEEDY